MSRLDTLRIAEIVIADDAEAWRRAGFSVDGAGIASVGSVRLRCARRRGSGGGMVAWSIRGVDGAVGRDGPEGIDGIATTVVDDAAAPAPPHANTTTHLDHVVIATPDVDRTVAAFASVGTQLRRERASGTEERPMRQAFLRAGEVVLEVVGAPSARGDGPASLWGLAFTVADLDACTALLGDVVGAPRDAVQPGRRIAALRHAAVGISVPTAFMSA